MFGRYRGHRRVSRGGQEALGMGDVVRAKGVELSYMWLASEGRRGPRGVMVVAASWMAICGDERLCTLAWPRSLERNMLSLALRSAAGAVSGIGGGAGAVTSSSVMVARADQGGAFEGGSRFRVALRHSSIT